MRKTEPTYEDLKRRLAIAESSLQAIRNGQIDTIVDEDSKKTLVIRLAEVQAREAHIKQVLLAIRNVNQLIVAENDPKRLLESTCQNLTETLGYLNAWIALIDDTDNTVKMTAASGFDGGFEAMCIQLEQGKFSSCMRQALDRDGLVVMKDPPTECFDCLLSNAYEGRAGMTHRLAYQDRIYGIISVSTPKSFAYDEEEQGLFKELANDLSFALYKIEADEQLHRLKHIVSTIPQPMAFVSRDYRYLAVNDCYAELFNISLKHILGKTVADYCGKALFETEIKPYLDRCLSGEAVQYEVHVDFPGKGKRWMEMQYFPYRDETGQINGVISHGLDITKRKNAEEALLERERVLDSTGRMARVGGWEVDANNKRLTWTNVTREIHEVPDDYVPEVETAIEFFHPEDRPRLEACIQAALENGKPYDLEVRFITAKGKQLWAHTKCEPVVEDGQVVKLWGTFQDITEQKINADALLLSERRYREIFEGSRDGLVMVDATGRFLDANQAYCDMLGYSLQELREMENFYRITPENWREWEAEEIWKKCLLKQGYSGIYEKEYIRKDGTVFPVELQSYAVFEEDGIPRYLWGVARDITQVKRVEQARRESHEMLVRTERIANVGSWEWDIQEDHVSWSEELFRIFGRNPQESAPNYAQQGELYLPEDMDRLREAVKNCLSTGTPYKLELRAIRSDGTIRHCIAYGQAERDKTGQIRRLVGFVQDVTERIQGEQARRESEYLLRAVIDAASCCIFAKDRDGRYLLVNKYMANLHNTTPEEMIGKTDLDYAQVQLATPEEIEKFLADDREVIDRSQPKLIPEESFTSQDGETIWFQTQKVPLELLNNKECILGVATDITFRKHAEKTLKASEEKFSKIF